MEDILVENCEFGDGNGMITCGSEATLIRNVTVRNCIVTGDATLLTLKLRPDTPQQYRNILIDGIKLEVQRFSHRAMARLRYQSANNGQGHRRQDSE